MGNALYNSCPEEKKAFDECDAYVWQEFRKGGSLLGLQNLCRDPWEDFRLCVTEHARRQNIPGYKEKMDKLIEIEEQERMMNSMRKKPESGSSTTNTTINTSPTASISNSFDSDLESWSNGDEKKPSTLPFRPR